MRYQYRFEKKKFVCFNKKINKQRAQLYGLTDNKEQYKLVEMDDYPIDKEVSIILDIWQLVASNVKDQA